MNTCLYIPKRIPDVEILPTGFQTNDNTCIGCKKTETDIMLVIKHDHSLDVKEKAARPNEEPLYYEGQIHIMLTQEQCVTLINQLDNALHRYMNAQK